MAKTGQQIIARHATLKTLRSNFESVWQEIADHGLGRRDFTTQRTAGSKRNQSIYDTTFALAAQLLSAAMHALLTNTQTRWFGIIPEDTRLQAIQEVRDWFYLAEQEMVAAFIHPEANFAPVMHEVYLDLPSFGNGCMFVGDRPGGQILFQARPLGEMFIAENADGMVDCFHRRFEMTSRQVVQAFGKNAPEKAVQNVEKKRPEEKLAFIHVVEPNDDQSYGYADDSGMPWRSCYVWEEKQQIVEEGGYWEKPLIFARWSKEAGDVYGGPGSPGWTALPDAKMLNEMSKTVLKAAQKIVDPPLLIPDDGVIGKVNTKPGEWTAYRTGLFEKDPIRPLQTGGNIELGKDLIEQRQSMVRKAFHEELLPLFQKPYMTATEVRELANQAQRFLSPTLGRLQVELLEPMIERVFGILLRAGRFPDTPEVLSGQNIRVEYVSPVARAQKESEVQAILDTFTVGGLLAQLDPNVLDNLNADAGMREITRLRGTFPGLVRTPGEVIEIRNARAEQAAAAQQMQQAMAQAEMLGKATPALTAGSATAGTA